MTLQRSGLIIVMGFALVALLAPHLAPYDPYERVASPFLPPSEAHWLGTNDVGNDILSELLIGARVTLLVGVVVGLLSTLIGTLIGLLTAYSTPVLSELTQAVTNIALVIPRLPLVIVAAAYLGRGLPALILVMALVSWPVTARVVHAQALTISRQEYVTVARSIGARPGWIVRNHLWPGVRTLVWAQFLLAVNGAALTEAGLSFLGLGDPTQKSWGTMLHYAHARSAFLTDAWRWWVLPPGLCLALFLFGLMLLNRQASRPPMPSGDKSRRASRIRLALRRHIVINKNTPTKEYVH
jgi:peptide/nickel transport system permease protein